MKPKIRDPKNLRKTAGRFGFRISLFSLLFFFLTLVSASAHLPTMAAATATIETNGKYSLDLTFDLPPFVFGVEPQSANDDDLNAWLDSDTNRLAATLSQARARFQNEFAALSDGATDTVDSLIFPTLDDVVRYRESAPRVRLPAMLMLSLEGRLANNARSVSFQFPAELGIVAVTVIRPDQPPAALVANSGQATTPIPIQLGNTTTNSVAATPTAPSVREPGRWLVVRQYLVLGFKHILPEGTDHILFVLGLFLLSCRLKPLMWQVTAFTAAHSITLGLSLYGVIRLPSEVVEPLIALSIAFVAVENICTTQLKPWRPFVVFGFGLVHGLGFSRVLLSLGLPRGSFLPALIAFNSGVELGQFTVIMTAFLLVGWWRQRQWYRPVIVVPASALIAVTGLIWTVQRIELALR